MYDLAKIPFYAFTPLRLFSYVECFAHKKINKYRWHINLHASRPRALGLKID